MTRSTTRTMRRRVDRRTRPASMRPVALDEHAVGAVHHDLGDRRIGEQRFERAEAADVVDQLVEHDVGRRRREQRRLLAEHPREPRAQLGRGRAAPGRTARRAGGGATSPAARDRAAVAARDARLTPPARRRSNRPAAARGAAADRARRGAGSASTPASTARAIDVRAGIVASTGMPSTSSTSRRAERPAVLVDQDRADRRR